MDIDYLNECMEKIQVINKPYEDVEVINHSPLSMMGKGRQGAVFRFTDEVCVKVFGNTDDCDREHYALSLGQNTNLFPKIFAKGQLYIAMEIIKGVDLREYLQSQPLTEELSMKLIEMLITFKNIGYERIDHHKRQVYLLPDGQLKVIDVARTIWRDRVYPYPRKLINSLGKEYKEIFLSHVQALSPQLYKEWEYYIEMERLSSQLFRLLLKEKRDIKKLKKESQILVTPNVAEQEYIQLENLVYKVFKNEWVKVMLAQGVNPDIVMEKIEEYWENISAEKEGYEEKYYSSYNGFTSSEKKKEKSKSNEDSNYQGYVKSKEYTSPPTKNKRRKKRK